MNFPLNTDLTESFLSTYRKKNPRWGYGGLGYIVYLRTYSRKKADGTLERWDETVERVINGNFKIEARRLHELNKLNEERLKKLRLEMERLYHIVFNLIATPPGRGLWMSGTQYAEAVGDAENNCWGVSMRPQVYDIGGELKVSFAPVFTFDQAMKGGGVGVNIQRKYVDQIPKVSNVVDLEFRVKASHPDIDEITQTLKTQGYFYNELESHGDVYIYFFKNPDNYKFSYGPLRFADDSREGWAESLRDVIDAHYEGINRITLDISAIRPRGTDIKGFGGTASGPAPLVEMLSKVNTILNRRINDFVRPVEWGDVIQLIGCCVVAGNVRRTALILIGDKEDQAYIESKNYSMSENLEASQWRWASNNSVDLDPDSSKEEFAKLSVNIYYNGEPGYTNVTLSRNYGRIIDGFIKDVDGEVEVFNPCGEITLPNCSPCNLFDIALPNLHFMIERGYETEALYEEVAYLAARYVYRVTFRHYEWATTRDVVYRHRRLGVGLTGITDFVLLKFGDRAILGFDESDEPIYNAEVTAFLDKMYKAVREANVEQAEELEASISIKVTTVKPSGTVSLLMGCSPGQHFHWSAYMIRRIRISANAPLVPILMQCGYRYEYVIKGYDKNGQPQPDINTIVFEFPVEAPTASHPKFQSAGDVPLKEQFALQALLQTHWADNSVSATLNFYKAKPKPVYFADGSMLLDKFGNPELKVDVREEQAVIDEITDLLYKYRNTLKSTSLLPYATDTFPQMPYEAISKEEYEARAKEIKRKPWEVVEGDIEAVDDDADDSQECVGGSCPIK